MLHPIAEAGVLHPTAAKRRSLGMSNTQAALDQSVGTHLRSCHLHHQGNLPPHTPTFGHPPAATRASVCGHPPAATRASVCGHPPAATPPFLSLLLLAMRRVPLSLPRGSCCSLHFHVSTCPKRSVAFYFGLRKRGCWAACRRRRSLSGWLLLKHQSTGAGACWSRGWGCGGGGWSTSGGAVGVDVRCPTWRGQEEWAPGAKRKQR